MPSNVFIAREVYTDNGENIDIFQILGPGAQVQTGETIQGFSYGNLMAQDNITATASGNQSNSFKITSPMARITTVVTGGDAVVLPKSFRGMQVALVNDAAANAANVFPAVGDAINALGANTAFSLTAVNGAGAGPTIFYCYTAGTWRTK